MPLSTPYPAPVPLPIPRWLHSFPATKRTISPFFLTGGLVTPKQMCILIPDPRKRDQEPGLRRSLRMSVRVVPSVCPLRGVIITFMGMCGGRLAGFRYPARVLSLHEEGSQGSKPHLSDTSSTGLSYYVSLLLYQWTFWHRGASARKMLMWGSSPKIK